MRNKVFIFFVFLFCVASICQAFTLNIQDNFKFIYHIIDSSGNHVSGQTVTLKIQRASDGYWYDFSDDTFKSSGWDQKSVNLSEDSAEGMYYYIYHPPLSESFPNEYIFLVNNSDSFYGDHQSMIVSYGVGDWTGGEKTLIKQALGINDGNVDVGGDLDSIFIEIKRSRGR